MPFVSKYRTCSSLDPRLGTEEGDDAAYFEMILP